MFTGAASFFLAVYRRIPWGIKPNNQIQALMDQMRAMQAQMQGLMACNNQRAKQQGSNAN